MAMPLLRGLVPSLHPQERHDALKREHAARSEDGGAHDGKGPGGADDRRP